MTHEVDEGLDASRRYFSVANDGSGTLYYSISRDVSWLAVNPSYGNCQDEWDSIAIDFTTAGLAPGTYLGNITVDASTADNAPLLLPITLTVNPAGSSGMRFCVPQSILIPTNGTIGTATPYPSVMNISGVAGTLTEASVELIGVHHSWPNDLDILLVGPNGNEAMLMSDAVGTGSAALTGQNLVFDRRATMPLPSAGGVVSGTFLPTDYEAGENLPSPATPGPYSTNLTIFGVSPNGTWKLFVSDDYSAADGGFIEGGWCLRVTTVFDSCSTNGVVNHLPSYSETSASGPAEFYPQSVQVQGVLGHIQKVTVSIDNLAHPRPDDLDILLVGPTGESCILLSDAGDGFGIPAPIGVDLIVGDNAASAFPEKGQISTGSYRPTNFGGGDTFPAPAPAGGYADNLGVFYGSNPNGTWSLYVVDDKTGERGQLARWCINLWVSGYLPPEMMLSQTIAGNDILLEVGTDGGGYYTVDGSTNLIDWNILESFDMTGKGIHGFIDTDRLSEPGPSAYFYRSRWTPEP